MKPEKILDYSLVPLLDLICQTINDTSFDSNYEKYIKESGGEPIFPSIPSNAVPLTTPENIRFIKEVLQELGVIFIASGYVEENEGDYFFEAIRKAGYKTWYKYYQNAQFLKFNRWSVRQLYIFKSAIELIEENPDDEYLSSARISENALPVDVNNLIKLSDSESLSEFRRNTFASFDTFLKEGLIAGISKEDYQGVL